MEHYIPGDGALHPGDPPLVGDGMSGRSPQYGVPVRTVQVFYTGLIWSCQFFGGFIENYSFSKSMSACMSAGSGVSNDNAAPVRGWAKPSRAACKAWRGKSNNARRAGSGTVRAAAGMRRR